VEALGSLYLLVLTPETDKSLTFVSCVIFLLFSLDFKLHHSICKWLAGLRRQGAGAVTAVSEKAMIWSFCVVLLANKLPERVLSICNAAIDKDSVSSKGYLRVSETYSSTHLCLIFLRFNLHNASVRQTEIWK
jgi:hypothetical protein